MNVYEIFYAEGENTAIVQYTTDTCHEYVADEYESKHRGRIVLEVRRVEETPKAGRR